MRKPTQKNSSTDQSEQEYLQEHEMSRRDFMLDSLALGGLAAAFGMSASTAAWGNVQPPADEVVRSVTFPSRMRPFCLSPMRKDFLKRRV